MIFSNRFIRKSWIRNEFCELKKEKNEKKKIELDLNDPGVCVSVVFKCFAENEVAMTYCRAFTKFKDSSYENNSDISGQWQFI